MAADKEYLDFILDSLSGISGISHRAMMGEYIIYHFGTVVGGIYDNRFLIKDSAPARAFFAKEPDSIPYPGSKKMFAVENPDDREYLEKLFSVI